MFADKRGQEWTISACERGIGTDPADADRIYQVFDRLHSIEEYEGSTFSVTLPAPPDAQPATGPTTDHE
ncbi:hypothetical protein J0X25_10755 [Haloterrigena alkaliphila]|uniref:Uncharacterized protein n=1 Tax=Haloterrigena alkaliphila TaxID=2816475 RepID=A0A8A2VI55_9EURY|nr:hypothetical protein [Haloterrigena alkaliphila]QSW97898.1 hypothetical protein J0X25_10755 [Haloterrigena alkaliphila]